MSQRDWGRTHGGEKGRPGGVRRENLGNRTAVCVCFSSQVGQYVHLQDTVCPNRDELITQPRLAVEKKRLHIYMIVQRKVGPWAPWPSLTGSEPRDRRQNFGTLNYDTKLVAVKRELGVCGRTEISRRFRGRMVGHIECHRGMLNLTVALRIVVPAFPVPAVYAEKSIDSTSLAPPNSSQACGARAISIQALGLGGETDRGVTRTVH